jgi:hypothetical protein
MRIPDFANAPFTRLERVIAWALLLLLGGLQAFVFADRLNPDGIAYLDIAAAYGRGDWDGAINPYWSPALSWMLALLERPLDLVGCGGLARVHVLIVGMYAFALWSFERLVLTLGETGSGPGAELRAWRWFTYAAFGMIVMQMIGLVWLTPDILLLGLVCLAIAFGLRVLEAPPTGWSAVCFGGLLGIAFWTKSLLFPVSFVILGTAWWLARGAGRRQVAVAAGGFAFTAMVWIAPLSVHEGRLTFGEAGRLNAAWFLDSVPAYLGWQGGDGTGSPVHPMIRADGVEAFAFPEPFAEATYPPWYAPAYWHEGARLRVRPGAVVRNSIDGAQKVLGSTPLPFAIASIAVIWLLGRPGRRRDVRSGALLLVIPGFVGLASYVVLHVELRLVAPMMLLSWIGLAAMPRLRGEAAKRWSGPICLGFAVVIALVPLRDAARQIEWLRTGVTPGRDQDCFIAAELEALGFERGTRVAAVGDASAAAWAWIGGLRIVADMPDADAFWSLDGKARMELDRFFTQAGARAVVAPASPGSPAPPAPGAEWNRLGSSGHLVRDLESSEGPEATHGSARSGAGDSTRESRSAESDQSDGNR